MFAPHFTLLLAEYLTPASVPDWLARWSDIEKAVWEGRAALKRTMYLDIANTEAAAAFQAYMAEVIAPFKTASHPCRRRKMPSSTGYSPRRRRR
jgi:hypothetical protein